MYILFLIFLITDELTSRVLMMKKKIKTCKMTKRGFPCPRCMKTFGTRGGMSRHYRVECVDFPRFKCFYCDMRSKYTQAIYRHIRVKHCGMEGLYVTLY